MTCTHSTVADVLNKWEGTFFSNTGTATGISYITALCRQKKFIFIKHIFICCSWRTSRLKHAYFISRLICLFSHHWVPNQTDFGVTDDSVHMETAVVNVDTWWLKCASNCAHPVWLIDTKKEVELGQALHKCSQLRHTSCCFWKDVWWCLLVTVSIVYCSSFTAGCLHKTPSWPSASVGSLVHILSPTSLQCWQLTYWLPGLPGVQAKNTHKPRTGAKISTASLFQNPQEWTDQPEPGSLYTGDNVLLESALLAGGRWLFWYPVKLCCDLFLHLQAGTACENSM